ncbi:hypothetical protein C8Q80DRAFT_129407 [Daedaleopsis nitida]|nr:hypothetical protein C8Q80DRAFT_129407 [Daedaleopsis nitida]
MGGEAPVLALLPLSGPEELLRNGVQSSVQSTLRELSEEGVLQSGLEYPEDGDDLDVTMTGYKMLFYKAALQVFQSSSPSSLCNSENDVVALLDNCPSALYTFYDLWRRLVPPIRALTPESRLLLRNVILCGSGLRSVLLLVHTGAPR